MIRLESFYVDVEYFTMKTANSKILFYTLLKVEDSSVTIQPIPHKIEPSWTVTGKGNKFHKQKYEFNLNP